MRTKNILTTLSTVSLMSLLIACSPKVNAETPEPKETPTAPIAVETNENTKETSPSQEEFQATLVFPATAYVVDGDETEKSVESKVTLRSSELTHAEAILHALQSEKAPANAEPAPLDKVISKVSQEGSVAVVDLMTEKIPEGTLDQEVLLRSIVNSLLADASIDQVKILLNGEASPTLGGHFDIQKPFTEAL